MIFKINELGFAAFLKANQDLVLSHFSDQIKDAAQELTWEGESGEGTHLRDEIHVEKDGDSHFIGSQKPYQSVAEEGMRQDGSYAWKRGGMHALKQALYKRYF